MKTKYGTTVLSALLFLTLIATAPPTDGAMVAQMSLAEMTQNAGMIARIEVLDVEVGSLSAGGGPLPITIYTLAVHETFKGAEPSGKDGAVIEVRMLGSIKQAPASGQIQKLSTLPELPHLQLGKDYVMFFTHPSSLDLCSPVGLGQGAFTIFVDGKVEMVANELNNAGLFSGPVTYSTLAAAINAELGQ